MSARRMRRVERPRAAHEVDRAFVELVAEQQPAVAIRPAETLLAELLEALADGAAPGGAARFVSGQARDFVRELVDQAARGAGVGLFPQPADGRTDVGHVASAALPERDHSARRDVRRSPRLS